MEAQGGFGKRVHARVAGHPVLNEGMARNDRRSRPSKPSDVGPAGDLPRRVESQVTFRSGFFAEPGIDIGPRQQRPEQERRQLQGVSPVASPHRASGW